MKPLPTPLKPRDRRILRVWFVPPRAGPRCAARGPYLPDTARNGAQTPPNKTCRPGTVPSSPDFDNYRRRATNVSEPVLPRTVFYSLVTLAEPTGSLKHPPHSVSSSAF
ncbi:uncharacterized protein PADG_11611 [Paracoccidioides brasiliensis Pb18]|uniref:Uncharacterized protein n=1 Tax=Paracoccidioides brasiliensis (strain Pb18) TaxID=502780 RepID=A0A0A0HUX0_PARBD|nr:uncharacterized protein PADG_11611 [Paracoccidioides brasiliensis Pb18]KGM92407.1 hypothetical protein PADG_11611 [Paracoccidioides brasiliensis Pb18]